MEHLLIKKSIYCVSKNIIMKGKGGTVKNYAQKRNADSLLPRQLFFIYRGEACLDDLLGLLAAFPHKAIEEYLLIGCSILPGRDFHLYIQDSIQATGKHTPQGSQVIQPDLQYSRSDFR